MRGGRTFTGTVLILLGSAALVVKDPVWVGALGGVGFLVHCRVSGGLRRAVLFSAPILLFAGLLLLLQLFAGAADWRLPARTIAVFLLVRSAAAVLPWSDWLGSRPPGSGGYTVILFLLFVRHFVVILAGEAGRALVAHRAAAPRRYGPDWFRSLAWALAGIFRRSLVRAERFYAAQLVRGLGG